MIINRENFELTFFADGDTFSTAKILAACKTKADKNTKGLRGRGTLVIFEDGGRKLALKPYLRGGLWGKLNSRCYLNGGQTRAQKEAHWLSIAANLGVPAPAPFFCVKQHGLLTYRCWLGMELIENPQLFLDVLTQNPQLALSLMSQICGHVAKLIKNSIWHIDLHPGNIIIQDTQVYIIDFDKARFFSGSQANLAQKYIERWQRAIHKYQLPQKVGDAFARGLNAALK